MNRKLRKQLKVAYRTPPAKQKNEFLWNIKRREQRNDGRRTTFIPKWIGVTAVSIFLMLLSVIALVPVGVKASIKSKYCEHHWIHINTRMEILTTQQHGYFDEVVDRENSKNCVFTTANVYYEFECEHCGEEMSWMDLEISKKHSDCGL